MITASSADGTSGRPSRSDLGVSRNRGTDARQGASVLNGGSPASSSYRISPRDHHVGARIDPLRVANAFSGTCRQGNPHRARFRQIAVESLLAARKWPSRCRNEHLHGRAAVALRDHEEVDGLRSACTIPRRGLRPPMTRLHDVSTATGTGAALDGRGAYRVFAAEQLITMKAHRSRAYRRRGFDDVIAR